MENNVVKSKIEDGKIIDIHNHIFPDKIAEKAVASTGNYYGISMAGKGTVRDLLESGSKIQVSKYIIHSTATKPEQVKSINDYILSLQASNSSFIGFGTLHPNLDDIEDEVERIISLGIKGIKLHPDFQRFYIDDASMIPIYSAIQKKLPLLIHMGDKNHKFSAPEKLAKILDMFPDLTVIAAHLGGYCAWDDSLKYLTGRNVYFDTSSSLMFLDVKKSTEIIKTHGVEKVLFGSDYPMWSHKDELNRLCNLDLTPGELDLILYKNALALFHKFSSIDIPCDS
ncbi:MAG: amidohydrolase family protein [Clostridiaceae bacterium]|nr:amidohydrolase family protein [Clostridiaceae bacterium]